MKIRIVKWNPSKPSTVVKRFLARQTIDAQAEVTARAILKAVQKEGDRAVIRYAKKFDGVKLTPKQMVVSQAERADAAKRVDADFKRAAKEAHRRIKKFSRAGLRKDWSIKTPRGGEIGEQFRPLDRVGAYIPGGASPLASTALMTVTLAQVAGVPDIVACTPSDANGKVNPYILYALDLAGVTEVYRVGGVQAIGAMAYGTDTVKKVQKIVGPGNAYVTAAKRLVYGEVDLDLVAGPSEIAVLADTSAHPAHVAVDLLSQAEHGTGKEQTLCVTTSARFAERVRKELEKQASTLSRKNIIQNVLEQNTLLVVASTLQAGADLINAFAPEHLELLVRNPRSWVPKMKAAGAIFVGPWTPESAGDFVAGPSHVLPTGGAAKMFSGLTVDDFRRRSSVIEFTKGDLEETLPVIEAFARVEDLEAHGRSARIRFE